jgi:WD40 repeat protein
MLKLASVGLGSMLFIGVLAWAQSPPPAAGEEDALPFGARARLGTTRFRNEMHYFMVRSRASGMAHFSPDGRFVFSNDSQAISVWETQTGKLKRKFKLAAECLAVAPKGTLLAYGWSATLQVDATVVWWDWQAGKEVGRVTLPPEAAVQQLRFSPDGKKLIGQKDTSLRIWDTDSRQEIKRWEAEGKQKLCGHSADGNLIAVESGRSVFVLNLQTMAKVTLQGVERVAYWVLFSPDGKYLTMRDYSDNGPQIWDVATGKVLWRLPEGSYSHIYSACFSADGKLLAAGGEKGVGLWDVHTGKFLKSIPGLGSVDAISPDGRWLAAGGQAVRVFDLQTGKPVDAGPGHRVGIERLEFLPDVAMIATVAESKGVRLWDSLSGAHKGLIDLDVDWIRGFAISPEGRYVAAGQPGPGDGFLGVWELAGGRKLFKLPGHGVPHYGQFTILQFSPDSRCLLSWGDDFYLRKWDMNTGKALLEKRTIPSGHEVPEEDENGRIGGMDPKGEFHMDDAAFTPRGDQFLLLGGGQLHCFDVASGKETRVHQIGPSDFAARLLSVSPTGTQVAITASRGNGLQLLVCNLASGKTVVDITVPGNYGDARVSPDGRTVAVAGGVKVFLVEVATGKLRLEIPAASRHLAFSTDGRFLITAMPDTTALVWDLALLARGSAKP